MGELYEASIKSGARDGCDEGGTTRLEVAVEGGTCDRCDDGDLSWTWTDEGDDVDGDDSCCDLLLLCYRDHSS